MAKRVLVVDDSPTVRTLVSLTLVKAGLDVVQAHDGAEALVQLDRHEPDLIITDLNMPVMGGMDFMKAVRASPAHGGTPVILLTVEANAEKISSFRAAGAVACMTKPFTAAQLVSVVDTVGRPVSGGVLCHA
ncbi:MAG: response regulator [Hyphomicrobiaceae bacterium]